MARLNKRALRMAVAASVNGNPAVASEFWDKVRLATKAVSQVFNGRATVTAIRNATPMQRAYAAGAVPGYPISNKWEELGHDTSWNYVGIHTVAKQWAQADWVVYDKPKGGVVTKAHAQDAPSEERTPVHDHEFLKLLDRPNPLMGRMQFLYIIGTHLRLTGGWAILEIRSKETGKPVEYWPLPRSWMTPLPPTPQCPLGEWQVVNPRGVTGAWHSSPLAAGFRVDAREVIVAGWPHPLYPGETISPLTACGRIIDIMEQTDQAVWSSLLNAYHNGMLLLLDPAAGPTTDEQIKRLVTEVHNHKGGTSNAGRVSALAGVKSVERPSIPLSELNAVEVRNQNKDFGLGIQGVPSVATGIRSEVGSYAGDAASFNSFAELGIQPDLDLFASVMTHRNRRYYGDDFELEGSAKRIDDPQLDLQRADALYQAVQSGDATPNEWRAAMKLPPHPDGDQLKQQPAPGMVGPDGQPLDPNAMGGGMGGEDDLGLDLDPTLADDEDANTPRPDLSRAGGRSFASNGRA